MKLKDRVENFAEPEVIQEPVIKCAYCGSEDIKKKGFRKNAEGRKQKYQCRNCKRFFVEKAFKKIKAAINRNIILTKTSVTKVKRKAKATITRT